MSYKFSREEQKELMQMIMYYRDMRYNDGHTAKYLCVEVDGVGGFYNNFKENKNE